MKIRRVLSPRAMRRFKTMTAVFIFTVLVAFISDRVAARLKVEELGEGPFTWSDTIFKKGIRRYNDYGYVEEYADKMFCHR